jgi:paraquat-inducible protein B
MSGAKPAIVGGFVLGGMIMSVVGILLVLGTHLFSHEVHAVVYFQGSVAGLEVGAPVTFRGVRVGSVTKIGLNLNLKDLSAHIPVYLALDTSVVTLVTDGSKSEPLEFDRLRKAGLQAQLGTQSFVTGQLRIDLDFLPKVHSTYLGGNVDGNEIPSSPSKLETLEAEIADLPLKQLAEDTRQTLVSIKRVSDALGPRIGPLADNIEGTSTAAHVALNQIDSLAKEGRQQLSVNGDELSQVLKSSDKTVSDVDTVVRSVNEMAGPHSAMRDDLQAATRDLAASASALRAFSQEIERNPSNLLKQGKAP